MRISDWSSDVCSSDLNGRFLADCVAARETPDGGAKRPGIVPGVAGQSGFRVRYCPSLRASAGPAHERRQRSLAATPASNLDARNAACGRSEEHTSELQSLMRISYAVFCLKKKTS